MIAEGRNPKAIVGFGMAVSPAENRKAEPHEKLRCAPAIMEHPVPCTHLFGGA